METIWFFVIGGMFCAWAVLDGFDFGAGILHCFVARTDDERRQVFSAIGPVWDGNEVWLVAAGGTLVFAFPRAYAAAFSGFYLPLMMVLWLLVLRGVSIEFRSLETHPLWRAFWDGTFAFSSALTALVMGVALGNLVRGVPLEESGYFRGPLFTHWLPTVQPGAMDLYTVLVGAMSLLTLAAHGAVYLVWKTSGPMQERCRRLAPRLWGVLLGALLLTTLSTAQVDPLLLRRLLARPLAWVFPPLILGSLAGVFLCLRRRRELGAFLCSAGFMASLLLSCAAGLYPDLLRSTLSDAFTLDVHRSAAGRQSLAVGLWWWLPALLLAVGYFTYLFRSFRGKVETGEGGHGY